MVPPVAAPPPTIKSQEPAYSHGTTPQFQYPRVTAPVAQVQPPQRYVADVSISVDEEALILQRATIAAAQAKRKLLDLGYVLKAVVIFSSCFCLQ